MDAPDPPALPRRRTSFRTRAPLEAQPTGALAAPVSLAFTPSAEAAGSDADILMGYQVFLGRDPENSFVIKEAKSSPVRGFLRGLMSSGEFATAVVTPLRFGQRMPHERSSPGPSPQQAAWLGSRIELAPDVQAAIAAAATWRAFWAALAVVPGMMPTRPSELVPAAGAALAAEAADEGFVLITIDQPKPGERLFPGALVSGSGWAIAPADIVDVTVHLDDTLLGHARYGLPRPDVARNFPHYRHVDHCGFAFSAQVPLDARLHRQSQLTVSLRSSEGHTGQRGIAVEPPVALPAGPADAWPIRLFIEDVRIDAEGVLSLRGWAVSRAELAGITVFLGELTLGDAELGLARPDIEATHPDYANAAHSGFLFAAALAGQQPGQSMVRVQARDADGHRRQAIVPVVVPVTQTAAVHSPGLDLLADLEAAEAARSPDDALAGMASPEPAGSIRFACDAAQLASDGTVTVAGWALADAAITRIEVACGGRELGEASLGQFRADVGGRFPDRPEAARSGFHLALAGAKAGVSAGQRITLTLHTAGGETRSVDLMLELVRAGPAADPARPAALSTPSAMRLEIDHPVLVGPDAAAPVHGALTVSGWVVAPEGIEGVTVFCDGVALGRAYVGMRREDIARAFPHCLDSLRAGFALVLPPGAVSEGERQFQVVAQSRAGAEAARAFSVRVEPADSRRPGCTIRTAMPRAEAAFGASVLATLGCRPAFTIVVRESGGRDEALGATLESLARQVYGDWTALVFTPDAAARRRAMAGSPELSDRVAFVAPGSRVPPPKPESANRPGLAGMLEAGDVLGCDALLEMAMAHAMHRDDGFLYGDELRFDPVHRRVDPFFKPDWSPELLLATNYVGRFWCATATVLLKAGCSAATLGAGGAYDAVLRLTEAAAGVHHVAKLLAARGPAAPETPQAEAAAIAAALRRRGIAGEAAETAVQGVWRVKRTLAPVAGVAARVSIVMPTCGGRDLVHRAIDSVRATTAGLDVEIVVLDNVAPGNRRLKAWLKRAADVVVAMPGAFNWSRFNNAGVAASSGATLLFLNDDIEAPEPGWLEALLEHAQRPDVGVVGARLLYPDGKVQHAGQYLAETHARHAFRFAEGADHGPFGLARASREMAAVTGACMLVRRDVFDRLGGFDEAHSVVNNDLDFCLRVRAAGLSVIYTPHAELLHHELASRASLEDTYDAARFFGTWRQALLKGDPFHTPRLLADADHYAPEPEPVLPVHIGPRGPDLAQVRRILAVKLDHIGDYLTAVPALRALRARFAAAHIVLLAPPATAALARHEAAVDEVLEFTFFHARSGHGQRRVSDAEFEALRAQLAPYRFDLAIDLRMQPETRATLQHSGAAFLAGYDDAAKFPFLDIALEWEGDQRLVAKHAHISERLLQLVAAVADACRPLAKPGALDALPAASVPVLARLPRDFLAKRLVCVHPGVGNVVRQWPATAYAALIDLLVAEEDVHAILIGGGDEQAVATEVMDAVQARASVISLVGAVRLAELPLVMRACALFVGNNSGPKHLAASLGVPTLGIHSGVVDAAEWGPLGGAAFALKREVICGPCYLEFAADCPRALACLTGIKPRDVLAACGPLLALGRIPEKAGK